MNGQYALKSSDVVAVIGSGAMGAGIAQVAAAAGHTVMLYDTRAEAVDKAIAGIGASFRKLADKGRMTALEAESARARLTGAGSLGDVAGAALVIEAIVEDLDAKRVLFAELEAVVGDDCILATNTSSISVTAIGARLRRPQRLAGMHFFNPVPQMALVEVVSGLATDADVAATLFATSQAWGKQPVHATSTPGFIVNRLARPFYAEGLRLLGEQAGDVATIDALMREAGGFRMGPFELMDLIGHDVNFAVTESVFKAYYNDPRFTPSVIQQELVNAGYLGRKSGRGFYTYGDHAAVPLARSEAQQQNPGALVHRGVMNADLLARFEAHGIRVSGHESPDEHAGEANAFHCQGALVCLTDGRSATQRAFDSKHADTVVFDLALDYATAPRIAIARASQCSEAAYLAVVGLFQGAGFSVTRLGDVPGLAVMRTVTMLANEAADAVYQGVCSAQDADTAMRKGVNYPRGPLAWADAVGLGHIVSVLDHLAAAYGDGRYRVSPLLRRHVAAGGTFHG